MNKKNTGGQRYMTSLSCVYSLRLLLVNSCSTHFAAILRMCRSFRKIRCTVAWSIPVCNLEIPVGAFDISEK
jgi:hypothetical protein